MAYKVESVTIRADNSEDGVKLIDALWKDVLAGRIPILFDSEGSQCRGVSPVSKYSNYESDESGCYDLTVIGAGGNFFKEMDRLVDEGRYKKYVSTGDKDLRECIKTAWGEVWSEQQSGIIKRAYTSDYECSIPAEYNKDGKPYCCLYVSLIVE